MADQQMPPKKMPMADTAQRRNQQSMDDMRKRMREQLGKNAPRSS